MHTNGDDIEMLYKCTNKMISSLGANRMSGIIMLGIIYFTRTVLYTKIMQTQIKMVFYCN